jgi:hypothetical protein
MNHLRGARTSRLVLVRRRSCLFDPERRHRLRDALDKRCHLCKHQRFVQDSKNHWNAVRSFVARSMRIENVGVDHLIRMIRGKCRDRPGTSQRVKTTHTPQFPPNLSFDSFPCQVDGIIASHWLKTKRTRRRGHFTIRPRQFKALLEATMAVGTQFRWPPQPVIGRGCSVVAAAVLPGPSVATSRRSPVPHASAGTG